MKLNLLEITKEQFAAIIERLLREGADCSDWGIFSVGGDAMTAKIFGCGVCGETIDAGRYLLIWDNPSRTFTKFPETIKYINDKLPYEAYELLSPVESYTDVCTIIMKVTSQPFD